MTSSIKILTTNTLDSAPSIILIAPNGKHTLINCGEGCQRSFLDARTNSQGQNQNGIGLRLKSIDRICVTQLTHACLGGLPGFILTSADTTSSASSDSKGTKIAKLQEGSNIHKKQISEANQKIEAGLTIWGPKGSSTFINSLRHFMRRDKFLLDIKEGPQSPQAKTKNGPKNMKKSKKRKKKSCMEEDDGEFRVECIPTLYTLSLPMASLETDEKKENDFKTKQNSHDKDPVTRTEEPDGQNSTIPPNSQQYKEARLMEAEQKKIARTSKSPKSNNEYQFVGVVQPKDKQVKWYARPKPKNSSWSVRVVNVDKAAILRDMFVRGKVDIYGEYQNKGLDAATIASASAKTKKSSENEEEVSKVPLIQAEYTVKERSWK